MNFRRFGIRGFLVASSVLLGTSLTAGVARAQVPASIETELIKMGHIVDPPCTAKLYRPMMPANDITSDVTPLYPGITIVRDVSFGSNPRDVVDIFSADKGPASRPVGGWVHSGRVMPGRLGSA